MPESDEKNPSGSADSNSEVLPERVSTPAAVFSTYFAEGFPYAIVNNLPEVLFKELGFSLEMIGLTALLHQPWNFKFLWAPFCELVSRRKLLGWCQIVLGGLLFLPSFSAFLENEVVFLGGVFFAMAIVAATNDIAIDGYYLEALSEGAQARWVGVRQSAYKIASILARGPGLLLAASLGFYRAFTILGVFLLGLGLLHLLFLPDGRRGDKIEKPALRLGETLRTLLEVPRVWVLVPFVISFRMGESLLTKMRYPFLNEQFSIGPAEWSWLSSTFGVIASLAGTTLGGFLLARHGLRRWFWPFILLQNGLNLLYGLLALGSFGSKHGAAWIVVITDEFGSGLGSSALIVFLMHLCKGEHKTSHFAFWTAIMSLMFTYAGALSGFAAKHFGFADFFFLTFAASIPMMLLALFVPQTRAPAAARSPSSA